MRPRPTASPAGPFLFGLLGIVAGCGKSASVAASCGDQSCPAGTVVEEYRSSRDGFDVSGGASASEASGDVAFANFGEGECRFTCVAMADLLAT